MSLKKRRQYASRLKYSSDHVTRQERNRSDLLAQQLVPQEDATPNGMSSGRETPTMRFKSKHLWNFQARFLSFSESPLGDFGD